MDRAGTRGWIRVGLAAGGTGAVMLALLCAGPAAASEDDPPDPEATQAAAEAEPAAEADAGFKPPPGFRTKKRGELTLYCRKETVLGSRFKAEKCYDQAGVEALQREDLENKETVERMRNCPVGRCPIG